MANTVTVVEVWARRVRSGFMAVCVVAFVAAGASIPLDAQQGGRGAAQASASVSTMPTPRLADGRPDLTGIWNPLGLFVGDRRFPLGGVFDMSLAAGLDMLPYQSWAIPEFQKNKANLGKDDLLARCMPPGVPRISYVPFPQQFVQIPGQLVILYEGFRQYRIIPTDGSPLPEDPDPTWMGYSSGRWEGDVLVVTTAGLKDKPWFDQAGNFHSEALRVTERFQRPDAGTLRYEVTMEDPKVFTRPWSLRIRYEHRPDMKLIEYICAEGERDTPHLVGAP